jgi:hypothetical protein
MKRYKFIRYTYGSLFCIGVIYQDSITNDYYFDTRPYAQDCYFPDPEPPTNDRAQLTPDAHKITQQEIDNNAICFAGSAWRFMPNED